MRAPALAVVTCAACVACAAHDAVAEPSLHAASPLALPLLAEGETPELVLAQRTITRTWGLSEDSLYQVVRVPEWRSEGWSMVMSAAVPGAGQLYVGERSGFLYLLAEAVGWTSHLLFRRESEDAREEAYAFAGDPNAPGSEWSFERWAAATREDPAELRALFAADPAAFYAVIMRDARYDAGWSAPATRERFVALQDRADEQRRRARIAGGALWLNHVVAAVDALRAARIHNIPLRQNIEIKLRSSWRRGPAFAAAIEGRF